MQIATRSYLNTDVEHAGAVLFDAAIGGSSFISDFYLWVLGVSKVQRTGGGDGVGAGAGVRERVGEGRKGLKGRKDRRLMRLPTLVLAGR